LILNLHYKKGKITLNSLKRFDGRLKSIRSWNIKRRFICVAYSKKDNPLFVQAFTIPKKLYFDYQQVKDNTGLNGGIIERQELDFIVKIPYQKEIKKLLFIRLREKKHLFRATTACVGFKGKVIGKIELIDEV